MNETFNLVVVSAGTSDPSSTRLLADRTAQRATALAGQRGASVRTSVIDLRELATDITTALTSKLITPKLQLAVDALGAADGIIAAAPVYKAGPSGLFTSFFHVLDNDLLIGKPVVLAATAGTASTTGLPISRSLSRSEEHTSELQSPDQLVCRLLLEKKKNKITSTTLITQL